MTVAKPTDMVEATATWSIAWKGKALTGARGEVVFTASSVAVPYSTATILPEPRIGYVRDGVMDPVTLEVNDPSVWNWRVTPNVGIPWEPFSIDVPAGGVNLATAAVTPGMGPVRAVQGIQGVSVVDAVDQGDGTVRYVLSDGSMTAPVVLPPGPMGPPTTLTVGTVSKGTEPSITLTGKAPRQVLSMVLPKGDKGDASTVPGPANSLSIGTVSTGVAGSSASASIAGTAPVQILSLTIPRGDRGIQGLQGIQGPAGGASVTEPEPAVWELGVGDPVTIADVVGLVDRLEVLAAPTMGDGTPTATAAVGTYYLDVATGDVYRMEA